MMGYSYRDFEHVNAALGVLEGCLYDQFTEYSCILTKFINWLRNALKNANHHNFRIWAPRNKEAEPYFVVQPKVDFSGCDAEFAQVWRWFGKTSRPPRYSNKHMRMVIKYIVLKAWETDLEDKVYYAYDKYLRIRQKDLPRFARFLCSWLYDVVNKTNLAANAQ